MSDTNKKRIPLTVENNTGIVLAYGTLYQQGNVQLTWRKDIGFTGEQYYNIAPLLNIVPESRVIRYWDKDPGIQNIIRANDICESIISLLFPSKKV